MDARRGRYIVFEDLSEEMETSVVFDLLEREDEHRLKFALGGPGSMEAPSWSGIRIVFILREA